MSKSKKNQAIVINADSLAKAADVIRDAVAIEKTLEIKSATLKDDFCNYKYELTSGPTQGDSLSRNGASIIHNDMKNAFAKLDVHLAVICEEIEVKKILDIDAIEKYDEKVHDEKSIEYCFCISQSKKGMRSFSII